MENWRSAGLKDVEALADLFWSNISAAPAYISHGEMQMGVAVEPGVLAENGKEQWVRYIIEKIEGQYLPKEKLPSAVLICSLPQEEEDSPQLRSCNSIDAFCVLEISEDGAAPFGIICDMLVSPRLRGRGLGGKLLDKAMEWFTLMGITDVYLESGVENHSAHGFFESKGFKTVSHIFKLQR